MSFGEAPLGQPKGNTGRTGQPWRLLMDAAHPHLTALRHKHDAADAAVAAEEARPMPDTTRLHALKKEKLAIKDAIAAFEGGHQKA
jgi:uncharacterized protein